MKLEYNTIIGITGAKNSGKDTIASMLYYIFTTGLSRANYKEWVNLFERPKTKIKVYHFADSLKDILSIMYNIPREYFDNRLYKDTYYYSINKGSFVNEKTVLNINKESSFTSYIVNIEDLENTPLRFYVDNYSNCFIKLRTLLQYFGTNICRNQLSNDFWIKHTMNKIIKNITNETLILVPDVRFNNEAEALNKNGGFIIKVVRNENEIPEHESEKDILTDVHFTIMNKSTKLLLFYKILQVAENIYNINKNKYNPYGK